MFSGTNSPKKKPCKEDRRRSRTHVEYVHERKPTEGSYYIILYIYAQIRPERDLVQMILSVHRYSQRHVDHSVRSGTGFARPSGRRCNRSVEVGFPFGLDPPRTTHGKAGGIVEDTTPSLHAVVRS